LSGAKPADIPVVQVTSSNSSSTREQRSCLAWSFRSRWSLQRMMCRN